MTKEQFLNKYGQPNTVVSFKNDAEKMEFLNECEKFDIEWNSKTKATLKHSMNLYVNINKYGFLQTDVRAEYVSLDYTFIPYTPSPKSLIKDGWMGVRATGEKIFFLPSIDKYINDSFSAWPLFKYLDDLTVGGGATEMYIAELYDNLGNLQWKREIAMDIEIERIQAEMNKLEEALSVTSKEYIYKINRLADDLSKLKGE